MKKELLVIGAGNIGRGVIGGLFLNLVTIVYLRYYGRTDETVERTRHLFD